MYRPRSRRCNRGVPLVAVLLVAGATAAWADKGAPGHSHNTFAAGEPGDPAKPFRTVDLKMQEENGAMSYAPAKIEVALGEQVKFVLTNSGELDHEFMLDTIEHNAKHKIAMQKNPEMEHDDPNGKRLQPKASAEILWRFTKPGTFEFACLIPGHYEAGMHGQVVVAKKSAGPNTSPRKSTSSKESSHGHH